MLVSRSFPLLAPIQLFQRFIFSDKCERLLQLHGYNNGIKRLVTLLQIRFMMDILVLRVVYRALLKVHFRTISDKSKLTEVNQS